MYWRIYNEFLLLYSGIFKRYGLAVVYRNGMAVCYSGYTAMIYVGYISYSGMDSGCTTLWYSDSVPTMLRYTPAGRQGRRQTFQTHGVALNILRFYTVFYAALRRSCAVGMAV